MNRFFDSMKLRKIAAVALCMAMALTLGVAQAAPGKATKQPTITMQLIDNMVDTVATQLIGTPYVLGAKGPGAFDCATFITYIFKYMGVSSVSGTSRELAGNTKWPAVHDIGSILRGDLLFFGSPDAPHRVSHVALYLGDGLFIHCSVSGEGVAITDFYAHYYYKYFIGARRLVKDVPSGMSFGIPVEMLAAAEEAGDLMSISGSDYRNISIMTSELGSAWATVYGESEAGGMASVVIDHAEGGQ